MNRKGLVLISVVSALVVAAITVYLSGRPWYEGRPASIWFANLNQRYKGLRPSSASPSPGSKWGSTGDVGKSDQSGTAQGIRAIPTTGRRRSSVPRQRVGISAQQQRYEICTRASQTAPAKTGIHRALATTGDRATTFGTLDPWRDRASG